MVEDALFELKKSKPLVLGHELLSQYINPISPSRPTIIKVHRDFLFDPYNTDEKIKELDKNWQTALEPVLSENSIIVLGYGGNDDSLMNYLKTIKNRKPLYWCYRGDKNKLSKKIINVLTKKDFIIQIKGFDNFMLGLNDKLGFEPIIDRDNIESSNIVKNALAYAKRYEKQLVELGKEDLTKEEEKAVKKLLPSWWDYELQVQNEKNDTEKEKIYKEGMKGYPNSLGLKVNYAIFLSRAERYDDAEYYYKKGLEIEPDNQVATGNYAVLLSVTKRYKDALYYYKKTFKFEFNDANINGGYATLLTWLQRYEEAEKYFKKSLKIEPNNLITIKNYILFLSSLNRYIEAEKYIKKILLMEPNNVVNISVFASIMTNMERYKEAEDYHMKALDLEPDNAILNGNYAQFLLIKSRKKEAKIYIDKAFENNISENELTLELWFYRLAHFSEYYDEAKKELDRLLLEGYNSIPWSFDKNINIAKSEGHPDIKLLETYAKAISVISY